MSVVNEVLHSREAKRDINTAGTAAGRELLRPNYQRQNRIKKLTVYELPPLPDSSRVTNLQKEENHDLKAFAESGTLNRLSALRLQSMSANREKEAGSEVSVNISPADKTEKIYRAEKGKAEKDKSEKDKTEKIYRAEICKEEKGKTEKDKTEKDKAEEDKTEKDKAEKVYRVEKDKEEKDKTKKDSGEKDKREEDAGEEGRGMRTPDFTVFSPGSNGSIRRLTGFPYGSKEAVCLGMRESCRISQLFAVDKILCRLPALDFSVKWSPASGEPFVFQAAGTKDMMQVAADILNRLQDERSGIRLAEPPTPYLKKLLNNSADAIGTIEGVHYTRLLPLAAAYLERHGDNMAELQIFGNYLIVAGQPEEVREILKSMESACVEIC
jgi:hypothetical protein